MRVGSLLAVGVLLGSVGSASAQVLSLEFRDGSVRLIAENVPVSSILDEWTRLGRTTFVNAERLPGAPVSLVLEDTPEQDALAVVLRGASGYVSGTRASAADGASIFDRVFILPTSSPVQNTAPAPQQEPLPPEFEVPEDVSPDEDTAPGLQPEGPRPTNPFGLAQPGGRVQGELGAPDVPEEIDNPEPDDPPVVTPGNPFGVLPGSARPGVISPVPGPGPNAGSGRTPR